MRAHRAWRDVERLADLLVRLARCDQAHDLELPRGESLGAGEAGARRRSCAEVAKLLAGQCQLAVRAEPNEYLVDAPQLARRALAVARLRQHPRQLTSYTRRI